jgi:hypothetical protein
MATVGRGNHTRAILSKVRLPCVLFANSELILSLTSRLSMSQGASNMLAAATVIATAAAVPANMSARGSFIGLTSAAIYCLVSFLEPRRRSQTFLLTFCCGLSKNSCFLRLIPGIAWSKTSASRTVTATFKEVTAASLARIPKPVSACEPLRNLIDVFC